MAEKPLLWLGSTRTDLRAFSEDARQMAGYQLSRVQHGEAPSDWKPLPSIGPGVTELRIRTAVAYRVIYVAKFAEAVYVLHAFEKRSPKIRAVDLAVAKKRWNDLLRQRRDPGRVQ
jgi:phage-related protein